MPESPVLDALPSLLLHQIRRKGPTQRVVDLIRSCCSFDAGRMVGGDEKTPLGYAGSDLSRLLPEPGDFFLVNSIMLLCRLLVDHSEFIDFGFNNAMRCFWDGGPHGAAEDGEVRVGVVPPRTMQQH